MHNNQKGNVIIGRNVENHNGCYKTIENPTAREYNLTIKLERFQ